MQVDQPLERVAVLVAGGGIVGLSASLFLVQHGVSSLLVERHVGTSIHPRARGVNGRTAEIFRELGVDEEIREAGAALAPAFGLFTGETLLSVLANVERRPPGKGGFPGAGMLAEVSPTGPCRCTQDLLEPILLATARRRGGDLRFGTELASFEQDDAGVTASIVERESGATRAVRADYLIAADGASARIREKLGIRASGSRSQGHLLNILFQADLRELVRDREFSICRIEREHPEMRGLIVSINNSDRWAFHLLYHPDRGEAPADFPPQRCVELIRTALGMPSIPIEILSILPWEAAVRVADTFQQGRVFLAGDAAHQMPPWGGLGANSGVADAHNLVWKLAAVLKRQADPALLDTYDIERRPVGRRAAEESGQAADEHGLPAFAQGVLAFRPGDAAFAERMIRILGYGYAYSSAAILPESQGDAPPPPDGPGLDGRPGTRAPHAWVERQGKRVSTLDLFGPRFTLLAGSNGSAWCAAARAAADRAGIELTAYRVGPDGDLHDPQSRWQAAAGVGPDGALLVRPDGFVAWRARGRAANPEQVLDQAILRLLGR